MDSALAEKIRSVVARYPAVKLAYLFGSQATGNVGPLSDVDVAVYLNIDDAQQRFDLRLQIMGDLCGLLHRNDVDVVVLNDVEKPEFAFFVLRDGIRVYDQPPYVSLIEPKIMTRYADFVTVLRQFGLAGIRP